MADERSARLDVCHHLAAVVHLALNNPTQQPTLEELRTVTSLLWTKLGLACTLHREGTRHA